MAIEFSNYTLVLSFRLWALGLFDVPLHLIRQICLLFGLADLKMN